MRNYPVLLTLTCFFLVLLTFQVAWPAFATSHSDFIHADHFSTVAPDTDVQLQWPFNESYSMSIDLKVLKSPESQASIFWGHQFTFMNGERGYIGFGIGGNIKIATVAVFDAIAGNPHNATGGCNIGVPFSTAGNGWQCFVEYDWQLGSNYRLDISRVSDQNGNEQWEGSVYENFTKSSTIIGRLQVPSVFGQLGSISSTWNEYSTASTCDTLYSSVIFSYPFSMNTAGNHAPIKAQVTYGNSTCVDSNIQYLGGGAYRADAGKNVTRTTAALTWLWMQEPTLVSQNSNPIPEFPTPAYAIALTILLPLFAFCASKPRRKLTNCVH